MHRAWRALLREYVSMTDHWRHHPVVPSHDQLSLGERAADRMRNGMGSWSFVFAALAFLAGWILAAELGAPIDNPQLTILNLVLSCIAALQGAILLIAAKRSDQVSAVAAASDYQVNRDTKTLVEQQGRMLAEMRADHAKVLAEVQALRAQVGGAS